MIGKLGAALVTTLGLLVAPLGADAATVKTPHTVVIDGHALAATKTQLMHGTASKATRSAYTLLLKAADADLKAGPWSVMDKPQTPPSGDKHDYMSQAPYWWAGPKTPDNPQGCPYVSKDGQRNPEADAITDHTYRMVAWDAIRDLALAWYYSGDPRYAARAELDIRTWFLNPATAMNPNLNFAQIIPCSTKISGTGIIDSSQSLTQVLDAITVLESGAPGWSGKDSSGLKSWFTKFLTWMRTSPQAKLELAATNNHGSFINQQNAAMAVYTGQTALARSIVQSVKTNRIDKQIKPDGSQPLELSRTMSWHYSNFNLVALGRLAEIGKNLGIDLWHYTGPNGGNLLKAVDFLIPAAEQGQSAWPYQQINVFDQSIAVDIFHAASEQAGDKAAGAAIAKTPVPALGDMWPVRPGVTSLDPPLK